MLAHAAMIGDGPYACVLDGKFKNKRIVRKLAGARRIVRWWNNLHARPRATPPALHAKSAEADVSPNLLRPFQEERLDLFANPLPFHGVESRARFDGNNLRPFVGERNPTFFARERQVKHMGITVILAGITNSLPKKQPQVCLVEIGPRLAKKVIRHLLNRRNFFAGIVVCVCSV